MGFVVRVQENEKVVQIEEREPSRSRQTQSVFQRLETFLNILNQACIGFLTIFMCWRCFSEPGRMYTHAGIVTIGFILLMAEGIMCMYNVNPLTAGYKRKTKTTLHWVLLLLGGGCGVAGALLMLIPLNFTFNSIHAKMGFSAFILCIANVLFGFCALFSGSLRKLVNPLLNKTFHTLLGIVTYVVALTAAYYGFYYLRHVVSWPFITLLRVVTLVSMVLTCIGPLKALYQKMVNLYD